MGRQTKNLSARITEGASVICIDQACDNNQLLISLSKNEAKWLSPIGWTDQQKVTLLDCHPNKDKTEIDIPAEFAKDIHSGDVLVLRCSELDLEKEFIWEASDVKIRQATDIAPTATGLASGFLSRFTAAKTEASDLTKSETELRAEEANRAAKNYKAKMEAATAAKEQAQRKALDAAREAEVALKMEAERITEMERAAKAFEEAQRLKKDEMRRVEEERRIEEARLAEEARRVEEARLREIAAQKEADRLAALKHHEEALDVTRSEELILKDRLKDLRAQSKVNTENTTVQTEDLKSRFGRLVTKEKSAAEHSDSFVKSASKLDNVNAQLVAVQAQSATLGADRQALAMRLTQASKDYQQAQEETEAALARAEMRRAELENIRNEDSQLSRQVSSVSEKLSAQGLVVSEIADTTQKLRLKSDTAQAELAQAKAEIEAIKQSLQEQAESDQNLRLETEATKQAIEDSLTREAAHCEAIEHLKTGGDPSAIADIGFETSNQNAKNMTATAPPMFQSVSAGTRDSDKGLYKRVRRSISREKEAQISIDVEDFALDMPEHKVESALWARLAETTKLAQRHSSSLMALGAVIGGVAILGGSYSVNKSAARKLEVKSDTSAPTQVAGVVQQVKMPKKMEFVDFGETLIEQNLNLEDADNNIVSLPSDEAEILALDTEASATMKVSEITDTTGGAFKLPDMVSLSSGEKLSDASIPDKDATEERADPEKVTAVKAVDIKLKPKVESEEDVNYPELTSDIQTRLFNLGFYDGDIDGKQTDSTKEAITNFKTLFGMPEINANITGALLTELRRAERDQDAAKRLASPQAEAQDSIRLVEATPNLEFYDTVQAVPSTPVSTDSLPDVGNALTSRDPAPVYTEAEYIPAVQGIITEAELIENAGAFYPTVAQQQGYYVNVAIEVGYDINDMGKAENIRIQSNDHSGLYKDAFEAEAISAIKKLQYDPKRVDGVAVKSKGELRRIVFSAG